MLIVQRAFHRVPLPGLVGLLIIGMLIGPGGAQILPARPVVELLGSIGLLFIEASLAENARGSVAPVRSYSDGSQVRDAQQCCRWSDT